ncbi:hypothetical protein CR513_39273, partial [Mucuna pruriens]
TRPTNRTAATNSGRQQQRAVADGGSKWQWQTAAACGSRQRWQVAADSDNNTPDDRPQLLISALSWSLMATFVDNKYNVVLSSIAFSDVVDSIVVERARTLALAYGAPSIHWTKELPMLGLINAILIELQVLQRNVGHSSSSLRRYVSALKAQKAPKSSMFKAIKIEESYGNISSKDCSDEDELFFISRKIQSIWKHKRGSRWNNNFKKHTKETKDKIDGSDTDSIELYLILSRLSADLDIDGRKGVLAELKIRHIDSNRPNLTLSTTVPFASVEYKAVQYDRNYT